jgi:4-amino-4-deoxy-L-arabinose transferase-like glycosyltransferase
MLKFLSKQGKSGMIWFLVIIGIGFVIRFIYLLQARIHDPLFYAPSMDALYHQQWAMAITSSIEFIQDAYFRAPLYPIILGLIYKIFGANLFVARLVQMIIGSISCGLLYLLARWLFNESVARIAGFLLVIYPLAIYFDGELLIPNLLIFLILSGFLLLIRSQQSDKQWYLPGLIFGLAAITRPNVLLFILAIAVWLIFKYKQHCGPKLAQFLVAVIIIIGPVTIRNYVVSKRLVLIAWQGGTNFYIGNNPNSDGITAIVPGTRGSWWGGYYDAKRLAEQAVGHSLQGADIDAYWMKQGMKFWLENPIRALELLIRKCYLWFSGYEVSNNRNIYFFKQYTFLRPLIFKTGWLMFPYGILLPLAIVGIYLSYKKWRQLITIYLFMITYTISFVIFFVTARFRMPFVIFTIPFVVFGVKHLIKAKNKELYLSLAIFVGSFIIFNFNLVRLTKSNPAQDHFIAALGLHQTGKIEKAAKELEQALITDSAVNILSLEATVRMELGQNNRAEQVAQAAVRLWPDVADAYGLAGNVYAGLNQFDLAQYYFEQAVKIDPYSVQALNNLGNLSLRRRDLKQARFYYKKALAVDPNFTLALFHLGLVNYYEGDKAQAHQLWQKVLKLDPTNSMAQQALNQLQ